VIEAAIQITAMLIVDAELADTRPHNDAEAEGAEIVELPPRF
jgi:hypothetical protein